MRPLEDIERAVENLHVAASSTADERILDDAFAALEGAVLTETEATAPALWQKILRSRINKVAAVVLVTAGIVVCVTVLRRPIVEPPVVPPTSQTAVTQADLKHVAEMAVASNVEGLVEALRAGPFEISVLAAFCLGEVGDERALPELKRQYLLAEEKLPPRYGRNPFAGPIARIEKRIRDRQEAISPIIDANGIIHPDVNETVGTDANQAGKVGVPPVREKVLDFFVVHKDTGEWIAGASLNIKIQREGPDSVNEAVTSEKGHYRIDIGDPNTKYVRVEVSKELFVPTEVCFRRKGEAIELPRRYTLELEPGTSIGGFVQNEGGGPIEGATVYLRIPRGDSKEIEQFLIKDHQEKTDADGFWRCDVLPAQLDEIEIRLAHPDYIDDERYGATPTPQTAKLRKMTAVMVMYKGVDVLGSVADANGQTLRGAKVMQGSGPAYPEVHFPRTETDGEGKFEFRQTRPGTMVLTVLAEGFAPELQEVTVHEGMAPVEVRLGPPHTIRGRVVDSDDNPIEGAHVGTQSWRGHHSLTWRAETDPNGRFEWNEAPEDEVSFFLYKESYATINSLVLSASAEEHLIEMSPRHPLRVRGKVVDADSNSPINNFKLIPGFKWGGSDWVNWQPSMAVEVAGGRYEHEFRTQADGYLIRIEADGYLPVISAVFETDQEVVFDCRLHKSEGLSGTVYLPDGKPAAGVDVVLSTTLREAYIENGRFPYWTGLDGTGLRLAKTGADGQFSFPPQTEDYLLVVTADDGYGKVTDEQFESTGSITLEPWGCVEGVARFVGEPATYVRVSLSSEPVYKRAAPRLGYGYSAMTDIDGRFVFDRVVPGGAVVSLEKKMAGRLLYALAEPVDVKSGATVSVSIGEGGRPVVGRVTVPAGYKQAVSWAYGSGYLEQRQPHPSSPASFGKPGEQQTEPSRKEWEEAAEQRAVEETRGARNRYYRFYMAHDGSFRVEGVPAGVYELQVNLAERCKDMSYGWEYPASLNYEFEVPDTNEAESYEPLDLGTLELQMKKRLKVGDTAEPFEAETFHDGKMELSDYRGKIVLLSFWRSQDAPSTAKLLQTEQVYESLAKEGPIIMLAVSLDDERGTAEKFLSGKKLKCISCFASEQTRQTLLGHYEMTRITWAPGYETLAFPYTLVIGPDGKILARKPSDHELETVLEEALIDRDSDEDLGGSLFRF